MNVRVYAELAVAVSLAAVLSFIRIKLPHLLFGGSVSLHTLPILVVALRHGVRLGALAGGAYGFANFTIGPYIVHPIQVVLDYPIAFAALGVAGIRRRQRPGRVVTAIAVLVGCGLRFACHFASGWVYFGHLAPDGIQAWRYSLVYNGSYMIPETAINLLLIQLVLSKLPLNESAGAGSVVADQRAQ